MFGAILSGIGSFLGSAASGIGSLLAGSAGTLASGAGAVIGGTLSAGGSLLSGGINTLGGIAAGGQKMAGSLVSVLSSKGAQQAVGMGAQLYQMFNPPEQQQYIPPGTTFVQPSSIQLPGIGSLPPIVSQPGSSQPTVLTTPAAAQAKTDYTLYIVIGIGIIAILFLRKK